MTTTFIPPYVGSWNRAHYPTAQHEAGHAVIADWEDLTLIEVRIDNPEPSYAGLARVVGSPESLLRCVLAGHIADPREKPISWPPNESAGGDEAHTALLVRMLGMSKADFESETTITQMLLDFLWPARNRVAEALMERGAIPGNEVHDLARGV